MTQHALVYSVEFQWLVLVGSDSLVINITNYEYSIKNTNQIRSSYQHQLRRAQKLLRRSLRPTARKRWLQSLPRTLDELISTASVQSWTVRQTHPNHGHRQQTTPLSYTCLTSRARYHQVGTLHPPFWSPRFTFFPLSTDHIMKQNKPLVATQREFDAAKIVFACIIGVQLITFIVIINQLLS